MNKNLQLFSSFFKIGLFTFGGGLAMLPLITNEAVEKHKWINSDEMLDLLAIAESTPGPIAVNAATYVGNKVNNFIGALVATIAVTIPSFIVILLITLVFDMFLANEYVKYAFLGIRSGVAILILTAVIRLFKKIPINIFNYFLIITTLAFVLIFADVSTIYVIIAGFLIGIIYFPIKERFVKEKNI